MRSQTWLGAGEPDAAAPLLDALGLGLAARTLLTPNTPSTTTRMTPANRALTPRFRGGGEGGEQGGAREKAVAHVHLEEPLAAVAVDVEEGDEPLLLEVDLGTEDLLRAPPAAARRSSTTRTAGCPRRRSARPARAHRCVPRAHGPRGTPASAPFTPPALPPPRARSPPTRPRGPRGCDATRCKLGPSTRHGSSCSTGTPAWTR